MKRIERVRLYPTPKQEESLRFMLDVTHELYNALLQERREAWRRRRITVSNKMQYAELTALRKDDARLAAVYRDVEDAALHRLDLAMGAFFRRCKRGEKAGYPRYKPRSRWSQLEYSHGNRALKFNPSQSRVAIPAVGNVRLRKGRAVPLKFGRAWIIERNRRWYLSVEHSVPTPYKRAVKNIVGVDRGVRVLGATSEGHLIPNACANERHRRVVTRLQRELDSTTKKDDVSGRCLNRHDAQRRKAALRLARARERERNARRDHAHKVSYRLVRDADRLALEALNVPYMTRSARGTREQPGRNVRAKAALNRLVLDAGFGLLQQMIAYKAESAGVTVVAVNARYSSQECSRCEYVARGNRRGRRFACIRCGFATHADVNAALVIRRRAQ